MWAILSLDSIQLKPTGENRNALGLTGPTYGFVVMNNPLIDENEVKQTIIQLCSYISLSDAIDKLLLNITPSPSTH